MTTKSCLKLHSLTQGQVYYRFYASSMYSSDFKHKIEVTRSGYIAFNGTRCSVQNDITVKILKIGTHKIITVTVLQLEQLDFTVQ